jgi:protocatechuate 3,4-dioxygenase beta subunit
LSMMRWVLCAVLFTAASLAVQAQTAPRPAAIAGRVIDEFGDPVINARVTVEKERSLEAYTIVSTAETDDLGEYRIGGLPAGTFVVAATTIGAVATSGNAGVTTRGPSVHKTYFPGAATGADAEALTLQPGEERGGIDLAVSAANSASQPFSVTTGGGGTSSVIHLASSITRGGTGVIRGQVLSTDGRTLPHAQVALLVSSALGFSEDIIRSDQAGAFEFAELPPGAYRVVASKSGYEPIVPDRGDGPPRMVPWGVAVALGADEATKHVDVGLAPLATLSGRVLDDQGDPLQGAQVELLHIRYEAGRRQLVPADVGPRVTDDLGRFRLFGLPAGDYLVSASIGGVVSADVPGYLRSYFPGTDDPHAAQFVSVRSSEAVTGVELSMVRGRTARIAGRILNSTGAPTMGGSVRLRPRRSSSFVGVSVGARLSSDGRFEFPNVPPGAYVIQADGGRLSSWTEGPFGAVPVVVNGADVTELVLQVSAGSKVEGAFRFDASDPSRQPARDSLALVARPVDADASPSNGFASAQISSDWRFRLAGLHGPRRLQLERAPAGWALEEIRVNGVDATDQPIEFGTEQQSLVDVEVVLTDRINLLAGRVTNERAEPAGAAGVVVFATDRDRWYPMSRFLRSATTEPDGAFRMQGLPAGAYYIAAVARLPRDDSWQESDFLEALQAGTIMVTLSDGTQSAVNLTVAGR